VNAPLEQRGQVPDADATFAAYRIPKSRIDLPAGVGGLVVVPEMREVRVQVSFSRFDSVGANLQGEFDFESRKVKPAVTAISLECGYSASSIRERLYCGKPEVDGPNMAGIMLSTGTTGSEGTLGGLVEEGRRIRHHLREAWDLGRLCSNDPVCAAHDPSSSGSDRRTEGAACHGCLYIAECSCERFNRFLDRALVVPTIGNDPELAFFRERP